MSGLWAYYAPKQSGDDTRHPASFHKTYYLLVIPLSSTQLVCKGRTNEKSTWSWDSSLPGLTLWSPVAAGPATVSGPNKSEILPSADTTEADSQRPPLCDGCTKFKYITRHAAPVLLQELSKDGEAHRRLEGALREVLTTASTYKGRTQSGLSSPEASALEKIRQSQIAPRKEMNDAANKLPDWEWLEHTKGCSLTPDCMNSFLPDPAETEAELSDEEVKLCPGPLALASGANPARPGATGVTNPELTIFRRPPGNREDSDDLWHEDELEDDQHSMSRQQLASVERPSARHPAPMDQQTTMLAYGGGL